MIDSMLVVGIVVACGMYLRERRTSARLRASEQFARACMRDAIVSRDELAVEWSEERARCGELMRELDAYRSERREMERRVWS